MSLNIVNCKLGVRYKFTINDEDRIYSGVLRDISYTPERRMIFVDVQDEKTFKLLGLYSLPTSSVMNIYVQALPQFPWELNQEISGF
jgi:hypothetical protein